MKDKISKVIFALLLIALIIFSCVGIFVLFNGLAAYKTATGNDWIGFGGGIVGSIIAGLIAVIIPSKTMMKIKTKLTNCKQN